MFSCKFCEIFQMLLSLQNSAKQTASDRDLIIKIIIIKPVFLKYHALKN